LGSAVPSFRYRALTQGGELVSGSISAPTAAEVAHRIEYLGLVPIDSVTEDKATVSSSGGFSFGRQPRAEDVTVFTLDLALLLKAGARLDDGLELLSADIDIGRLRSVVAKVRGAVLAGESFADAISHHPLLFPPIYVALVRVGEASGALPSILEVLANERARSEAVRRKIVDALRYPGFVLFAAASVLVFFLMFVLPQFATVLRDFGVKLDPIVVAFLGLSDFMRAHTVAIPTTVVVVIVGTWLLLRRPAVRVSMMSGFARLPLVRTAMTFHRTALFCRNLGVLLGAGVPLTTTLRILVDMLTTTGNPAVWMKMVDRVRHGGKLSDAVADTALFPSMAARMLRLGEETGQLPMLSSRVAEFYEAKLQRSLDRVVGISGPAAIIAISVVVGGLIVSVMTSLLSVSQIVQ
jgi:general secretion pathway protein F